jgi:hypothetical protein
MALQTNGVRRLPFSEFSSFVYIHLVGLLIEGPARYKGLQDNANTDVYLCPEWDSNPLSQCSSGRRQYTP